MEEKRNSRQIVTQGENTQEGAHCDIVRDKSWKSVVLQPQTLESLQSNLVEVKPPENGISRSETVVLAPRRYDPKTHECFFMGVTAVGNPSYFVHVEYGFNRFAQFVFARRKCFMIITANYSLCRYERGNPLYELQPQDFQKMCLISADCLNIPPVRNESMLATDLTESWNTAASTAGELQKLFAPRASQQQVERHVPIFFSK